MANVTELQPARAVARAIREIRLQVSVVRVLLDEVDAIEPALRDDALARLGCRLLETASDLSKKP